jgi:hypothetical protein
MGLMEANALTNEELKISLYNSSLRVKSINFTEISSKFTSSNALFVFHSA